MLPGRATPEGTARFRDAAAAAPGHFRQPPASDLWLSSLGIGTYLGRDDAATDALYASSVRRALQLRSDRPQPAQPRGRVHRRLLRPQPRDAARRGAAARVPAPPPARIRGP